MTDVPGWRNYALGVAAVVLPSIIAFSGSQLINKDSEISERVEDINEDLEDQIKNIRNDMWTEEQQTQFNDANNPLIRTREFDSHVKRCEAEKQNIQRELDNRLRSHEERISELIEDIRRIEDRFQIYEMNDSSIVKGQNYAKN